MTSNSSIPRRIIQTAKSANLPPLARAGAANLRLLHPDWEYLFFDDAAVNRFIADHFPHFQKLFESFPYKIQRFDFFRYLAVFHFGGFYFDLDVFLSEELSPLLPSGCVFPMEELTLNSYLRRQHRIDWELGNYAFGAAPGHPFLAAIIENCVRAATNPQWAAPLINGVPSLFRSDFIVLNTTGPGLVTRTYAEDPALAKLVSVLSPGPIEDERHWHQFGRYGVHLMEASWRSRRSFLWRRLALAWENRRRRACLAESRSGAWLRPQSAAFVS